MRSVILGGADRSLGVAHRLWIVSMLFGGWFLLLLYSAAIAQIDLNDTVRIFVIFWFVGSVGFFVGSIAGFLFGIPKTVYVHADNVPATNTGRYRANANIEEISDWLTKIIVGLTLVNIRSLSELVIDIGESVRIATVPTARDSANPGASIVAIASLFYGFACGLLRFYFWSRDLQFEYEARHNTVENHTSFGDSGTKKTPPPRSLRYLPT